MSVAEEILVPLSERSRRKSRFALSVILMVIVWEAVSLLAGQNTAHQALVPGIVDVANAFRLLANYWTGGLGVTAPVPTPRLSAAVSEVYPWFVR